MDVVNLFINLQLFVNKIFRFGYMFLLAIFGWRVRSVIHELSSDENKVKNCIVILITSKYFKIHGYLERGGLTFI